MDQHINLHSVLCLFYLLLFDIVLLCLFFFFFSSRRRHTRSLCDWSSDVCSSDLIQQGLKNNLQLQQEQLNYERSMENLTQAKALFLPHISANSSYQFADGGRKITIPVGDLMNPVYSTLNQLTGTNNFPQIGNSTTNFLASNFHDSKVRVIQPLFNPEIYFNYKAQKELITVQQAQKKAYENNLKYEIASAYYQYLQSGEALIILKYTRTLLHELLKINQKLVANAKATRDVVLNTEYEINKT